MRRCAGFVLAVMVLNPGQPVRGQASGGWVGTEVVCKSPQTLLKVGDRVVADDKVHRRFTVERVNGSWLWVVSGWVSGWVKADQVVPFDRAIDYFTGVLRVDPHQASAYVGRAMIRISREEGDLAFSDLSEAIRLDPKIAWAYIVRGFIWEDREVHDKAIADFTEAIRLDPKDATAYLSRGRVWGAKQDYDKAIADLSEATRLNPKDAEVHFTRGLVWHSKGDYGKAIADATEAIRLDPKGALAYLSRGLAWHSKGDYDRAIADCTEAIRLDPKDAEAYFARGRAWGNKQDYDRAIADYTEAIRLDPKDAEAYFARGSAWGDKQDYDKAITDLSEAIRLDPKNTGACLARGLAWHGKGDEDRAIADYTEAIRLDPDFAIAYSSRARTWGAKQEHSKAIADATRACELTGWKNAYSLSLLADTYNGAGNFDAAVRYQEKALGLYLDEEGRQQGLALLAAYQAKRQSKHASDTLPGVHAATAPDNGAALLLAGLVVFLVILFSAWAAASLKPDRNDKQADGVSDPEHDPIPEPKSPKEPVAKPVSAAPPSKEATMKDVKRPKNSPDTWEPGYGTLFGLSVGLVLISNLVFGRLRGMECLIYYVAGGLPWLVSMLSVRKEPIEDMNVKELCVLLFCTLCAAGWGFIGAEFIWA
jgi:tetratricopeptide (TPR) repeat protein